MESYSSAGDFLQYISFVLMKNHHKVRWRCWAHEVFLHRYFLTILIMVNDRAARKNWRNILCSYFRFIWLSLHIAMMKRRAEQCGLQLPCLLKAVSLNRKKTELCIICDQEMLKSNFFGKNKNFGNALLDYIYWLWLFHSY